MPYINSNGSANDNELFNKALLVGGTVVGAAAIGQMAYSGISKAFKKGSKDLVGNSQVAKALYNDIDDISYKKLVDGEYGANIGKNNGRRLSYSGEGTQYQLKDKMLGGKKLVQSSGSWGEKLRNNGVLGLGGDKDLKRFNSHMSDMKKGVVHGTNTTNISKRQKLANTLFGKTNSHKATYGNAQSKMMVYGDLARTADNYGLNVKNSDLVGASKDIYNSRANEIVRARNNINNEVDDVSLANGIWDIMNN